MYVPLRIEALNDDLVAAGREVALRGIGKEIFRRSLRHGRDAVLRAARATGSGYPKPWVAEVEIHEGRVKNRHFLRGKRDYSRANESGSRGIFVVYFLEDGGQYEVNEPCSDGSSSRYFAWAECGEIIRSRAVRAGQVVR